MAPKKENKLVAPLRDWYQQPDPNWYEKDGCEVIKWDPSLEGFKGSLMHRSVIIIQLMLS